MAFGALHESQDVMSEINMTPLVDVMLVLLIIFIITIPVMKHAVNVDLPVAANTLQIVKPDTVLLSVDAQGQYFLNGAMVYESALAGLLKAESARQPQPELHIRADKAVRYERVAKAMASAQQAGLRKIGFVTEPGQ
ncbi:MAG: biopolymer transporter ExbD [Gammaproteobacteria bacterium]|uniref:ExbD/TolR family protein n=1 Tax=Rhodoferax sp. TaxID=50421 RepID=UPI00185C9F2A|nr:biopolymer transporter ExbD [Rhodoferax sp.]MBU3897890.1 biopolymer transporter ExbD [Gammaproteobacteria bacterium]MBA3057763.1 biopolymer transporter ExbD [Rhodoferax sp.]MBU3998874.1 biopolymer transporter ExbD [Gammaproteobacteria bacterium]MBU4019461.1 biopolymer transporter ExbD [Gammaproteobacteria bacterium]MBU4080783.1 biopolymer transporter ExbD [Gammaproteobacteria bacterium]